MVWILLWEPEPGVYGCSLALTDVLVFVALRDFLLLGCSLVCVCVCVCQDLEQLLASQRRGNNWVTVPIYRDRFPSSCELFQAWRLTQTLFFSLVSAFLVVLRG